MTERSPFKQSCPFKLELCDSHPESTQKCFFITANDELSPGPDGFPTASFLVKNGTLPESAESTEYIHVNLIDHNSVISPQKVVVRRDVLDILCWSDAFDRLRELPFLSSSAYFIICATKDPGDLPGIVKSSFVVE